MVSALVMSRGNYDFKRLFTISEFYDRDPSAYYGTLQRHLRSLIAAGLIRAVQSSTHDPTAHYEANS
jgi:DNA-binding HxlR family transcriptional regulator